jgi:HSP20 family protein
MLELSGNSGRVQSLVPAIDVYDVKDLVVIETVLPGVDPKNVTLSVEKGMLIISGTSERKTEVDDKDYYRKEIRSGSFMRQVALPAGTSEVNAKASFKDGILKIEFPKTQIDRPKTIKIEVTSE